MNLIRLDVKLKNSVSVFFLLILCHNASAWKHEYTIHNSRGHSALVPVDIVTDDHYVRSRRDAPVATNSSASVSNTTTTVTVANNATINKTESTLTPAPTVAVTQIPLLGVNGSGILKINLTENTPQVSDPIVPDDNFTDVFKETPERIKSEQNLTNLTYDDGRSARTSQTTYTMNVTNEEFFLLWDNHNFYNSTFIGNETYFNEYWANISKPKAEVHAILSNSHRRATSLQLKFAFPFYGHDIHNITVATGGFVYTGEHVHNWLAATQYIAPLMANFDTTLTNDSYVKLYDDGEKFTAFWENVTLQDEVDKTFTFAVSLYKNGDIIFAYKHIPIDVQKINDTQHPVKVGISDAYLNDNIIFYVRRKTIYEYHRVSFRNYFISNNTILKLTALPTCLQYDSCESCVNHDTGFNCTWCPQINKCSSGTDRNKQDWKLRNCDKTTVRDAAACPAGKDTAMPGKETIYKTDTPQPPNHNTSVDIISEPVSTKSNTSTSAVGGKAMGVSQGTNEPQRSAVGGVVAAFLAVTLVCGTACWVLYAFKNPHTRSGQILIKYRPSQWSWRRGEARYTAATIHM